MGMAASQARLLSLQARQSNLEYQGQQINQERTILSQQCTALYNSLLAMTVPTPPSTADYTTIEYSGSDGATKFTLGNIKPSGENYCVEIQTEAAGAAIVSNHGSSVVGKGKKIIPVGDELSQTTTVGLGNYSSVTGDYKDGDMYIAASVKGSTLTGKNPSDYMVKNAAGNYEVATTFEADKDYFAITSKEDYDKLDSTDGYTHLRENTKEVGITIQGADLSNYYVFDNQGNVTQLTPNSPYVTPNDNGSFTFNPNESVALYKQSDGSSNYLAIPNAGGTTVAGKEIYTFDEAVNEYPDDFDWEKYKEAIRNTYGSQETDINEDDFYVFFTTSDTGIKTVQFALKTDVDSPDGYAQTFSYTASGTYTKSEEVDQCKLQFDTQGRIIAISIPIIDQATGEILSYRDLDLKAVTVTDNAAYQDAYNQYEYAQYEYDQKQQEINAKTEILQQQDRNLELKLQRLDNERTQITTEIEAVEKVINENIEDSYKTFSG